jgi:hypothetical protein
MENNHEKSDYKISCRRGDYNRGFCRHLFHNGQTTGGDMLRLGTNR